MPLETGSKISELNAAWPLGSDQKAQGDDHIRLIKAILQADAPSLAEGGTFVTAPEVPDGATGKQVPNADDIPGLAGTGPVEIVEANASAGWQVWGDTLIQWGAIAATDPPAGLGVITYPQPFKAGSFPRVSASTMEGTGTYGVNVTTFPATNTDCPVRCYDLAGNRINANVQWVAVGEAPDNLKKPKTVQTLGGSELQEFHDPTGVASWRIVGNTLECWGSIDGNNVDTVVFPKQFSTAPNVVVTAQNVGNVNASVSNITTSDCLVQSFNADTAVPNPGIKIWRAIGEWDGVS